MSEESRTGGCLCGGVRYRLTGDLRPVVNCHCGQCRRFHGHHGAYTTLPMERFTLLSDATLRWYRSSDIARRGFCSTCGSSLFWQRLDGRHGISVAAGTLDEPTGLFTLGDIFVADKGDYYEIDDGLPQHERSTPSVPVSGG